jgi:hypothetical protein
MNKKLLFLFGIVWTILIASRSFAGECLGCKEDYLKAISKADPKSEHPGIRYEMECLYHQVVYLKMGYEYFASPTAIKKIQKENEPTKDLAYEVLPKFLESPSPHIRRSAIEALAYYGWPESFEYLMKLEHKSKGGDYRETISFSCHKAIPFAILGDKRAIPWIIGEFKKVDKMYRSRPMFSYPSKMTYLNALYHLASPEILPFINEVIKNPKPKKIKSRAKKVRSRIYELFPEAKNRAVSD